jgi:hypothetical protein
MCYNVCNNIFLGDRYEKNRYQLQKNRAVKRQSELVYVFDMMDDDAIINL